MMHESKPLKTFALAAVLSFTLTACGQPETPRTVSDFCLNGKIISLSVAPGKDADDPGNQYDTDETVEEVLAHNAALVAACKK